MTEEEVEIKSPDKGTFKELRNALIELYLEGYRGLEEYAYNSRWMVKRYLNWLYKGDPQGFFVITVNGKPVGFAASHSRWLWGKRLVGEIHEVVIAPSYRRRGLATRLLHQVINYLRSKGRRRIGLWVGKGNTVAKELYRKLGFRPTAIYNKWERWEMEVPSSPEPVPPES